MQVNPTVTRVPTLLQPAAKQSPRTDSGAPWSLTASDGSGLELVRVDAKAVVEGPLAFTEVHLYFHNAEDRRREGTFAITLPPGAAVSRFAMENDGQMMEAEVVDKQLARRAYEDFLHRRQDPALLEKAEGNQFTARVFPILPKADKHVVISFSQEVTPGHYALPLRGLAKTERVDVQVSVRGADGGMLEQTLSERAWLPDRDVVVDGSSIKVPSAVTTGDLVAARVAIELPKSAEPPAGVTLLVDTSASRALGFANEVRAIRDLVGELARDYGAELPVQVVAFDQTTEAIATGTAGKLDFEQPLLARDALGASDLGQALAWLGEHHPLSRVIVVGDAVVTAGAKPDALGAIAKKLPGVDRIDVVLAGGIRDDQTAALVARAGLAHAGAVLDLDRGAADVAHHIGLAVATDLPIAVTGASWVFPRTVAAAQSGDDVMIYVRRDAQARGLDIKIGSTSSTFAPVPVMPALLQRSVAAAEIGELDAKLAVASAQDADALRKQIAGMSIANRVVSSQTSLLVLETDDDYARFGIQRNALADILVIGTTGVELQHRALKAQLAVPENTNTATLKAKGKELEKKLESLQKAANKQQDEVMEASDKNRAVEHFELRSQDTTAAANGAGDGEGRDRDDSPTMPPVADPTVATVTRPAPTPRPPAEPMPVVTSSPPGVQVNLPTGHTTEIAQQERRPRQLDMNGRPSDDEMPPKTDPLKGPLGEIEGMIRAGDPKGALAKAHAWHAKEPGDVLALIALGDSFEANKNVATAARVYGSIIDLYPSRADFRRFAGERLERIGQHPLVIDTYRRAVEQRPDHLTGHRLLAYALLRDGQYAEAFAAILAGVDQKYPEGRYLGGDRVLAEDAGMIGAAYLAHGGKRDDITAELAKRNTKLATEPSTRFIMYWETDANDVDFHIRDAHGGHAWYSSKHLPSGGDLYADITTGYGPECFAIQGAPKGGPYQLSINYFSQGPMGYGMGLLEIQKFDGKGGLAFEDRPYVIMNDHAFVDLGKFQ
ncbi:MAG TPA: VIT domain-containing protein [Kofleriaceae bacterium]|nr:VIT domain-containing protein [Kofleriaceae bacterium]